MTITWRLAVVPVLGLALGSVCAGAAAVTPSPTSGLQQTQLLAGGGNASVYSFGSSVALDGNVAVVGASGYNGPGANSGAVYVFQKPATGSWRQATQVAILTADDAAAQAELGYSVAISGSTIVAGAEGAEVSGKANAGAAYVFTKPAGGWHTETQAAKLSTTAGASGDHLGWSVAIDGPTIAVGAPDKAPGGHSDEGGAYVFTEPLGGWTGDIADPAVLSFAGEANDRIGQAVAVSGNDVYVGDPGGAFSTDHDGLVLVYTMPVGGWHDLSTVSAGLEAGDASSGADLGEALAVSGNTLAAGAVDQAVGTNSAQGAVFVFQRPATGWESFGSAVAELTQTDGEQEGEFGTSVAVSGGRIAAGASQEDLGAKLAAGRAAVFVRPAGGWTGTIAEQSNLASSSPVQNGVFGNAIALGSTAILVGSFDTSQTYGDGSAFLFALPLPTVTGLRGSHPTWRLGTTTTVVNPAKHHLGGTTFSLRLNRAAAVTMRFVRHRAGVSHQQGVLNFAGRQGSNRVYFDGRLKGKSLPTGKYTLLVQAANGGGQSTIAAISFTAMPKASKPKH